MNITGFPDWKVALTHRACPPGAKAHLFFERSGGEELFGVFADFLVQCRIDAVIGEDGETNLLHGVAKFVGKRLAVIGVA